MVCFWYLRLFGPHEAFGHHTVFDEIILVGFVAKPKPAVNHRQRIALLLGQKFAMRQVPVGVVTINTGLIPNARCSTSGDANDEEHGD